MALVSVIGGSFACLNRPLSVWTTIDSIAHGQAGNQIPGRPPFRQTVAIAVDRRIVSRASIDPQEYPDGVGGRSGGQITGGFSLPR